MPRVANIPGPYWFYFYSFDCNERMHVHVRRENRTCKFWLQPAELAANHRFAIERHLETIRGAWHEHCGNH
jgi:Domain of unknown function (DUF4160)